MEKKTKYIQVRLTSSQLEDIRKRSASFGSMTHFINQAIKEFSDTTVREKLQLEKQLVELYAAIDAKLAHAGGNLNQAMRRINENAQAGLDYSGLLKNKLLPEVQSCSELCVEVRKQLRDITMSTLS